MRSRLLTKIKWICLKPIDYDLPIDESTNTDIVSIVIDSAKRKTVQFSYFQNHFAIIRIVQHTLNEYVEQHKWNFVNKKIGVQQQTVLFSSQTNSRTEITKKLTNNNFQPQQLKNNRLRNEMFEEVAHLNLTIGTSLANTISYRSIECTTR